MSAIPIVKGLGSVEKAVSISSTSAQQKTKGVYVGTDGDYYFEINSVAVQFKGCLAGTTLPIRVTKVATDSGLSSAVSSGDILFLY
jgi:hypothetical protein|tara:strand:- start:975 stop:1232 length:258 start_codon:yes stop_codon:yes gene_type:complete